MTIARTDKVYLAMWALLVAVRRHNQQDEKKSIETIACPGLGTATGRVPVQEAARQMALAYTHSLNPPPYIDWQFANKRQSKIRYGGNFGVHIP